MLVLAWTCDCLATVYELCQVGGQGFIRRTLQYDEASRDPRDAPLANRAGA
ncbi:hypothetical protein GCM10009530_70790 [Microbispora corallina]|uniref:Uncharacterized protein n=1 Tax=Microbispora corallina TaxID=83302 RepID=A0ABQ4GAG5_9ACTN|nr:hypothetical protein Mco01_70520 [Microbispora corallina]